MKQTALLFLSALMLTASAQARIGETIGEVERRFGRGEKVAEEGAGAPRLRYRRDDLKIDIQFENGRSKWELYHATGPVTKLHIRFVLDHNSDGHQWVFDPSKNIWTRDDGQIRVSHFEGRPNELFVERL